MYEVEKSEIIIIMMYRTGVKRTTFKIFGEEIL